MSRNNARVSKYLTEVFHKKKEYKDNNKRLFQMYNTVYLGGAFMVVFWSSFF